MKKAIKGTLQEADHNPVRVGDKLTFVSESRGGGSDGHRHDGDRPRPPRGAPKWFQEFEKRNDARWTKQEEFNKTIQSNINDLKVRMIKVEKRLNRVDDVLEYNVQAGVLRAPK